MGFRGASVVFALRGSSVVGPEDVPLLVSGINETTCRGGRAIAIGEEAPGLRANIHDLIVLPRLARSSIRCWLSCPCNCCLTGSAWPEATTPTFPAT